MNVSLQNIDSASALLTIDFVKSDYQENVDNALKKLRRDAQMPGFRKGMVPIGLIKKMYGKSVLADEVNKLLSDTINKYIQDNNVNILGEPLPDEEKQKQIDFDTMDDFSFYFDLALAPEIKLDITDKDKVTYYTVEVTDEMVDEQVKVYAQRNGKYEKVDDYQDNDMLKGLLAELDENGAVKEDGIKVEGAVMMPQYMKNDEQKNLFAGKKVGDEVTFNPAAAWEGNAAELASLLRIEKDAAENVKADFSYKIEEITRYIPGDLNQEIFDQVFGKDAVKTEEEFRARVKEVIAAQFSANSDFKFLQDLRKALIKKAGKLEFSEKLLKRIMRTNNPDKDDKFIDENYDKSIEELTWQLIKDQLIKENNLKVEESEIVEAAKGTTRAQFAQYGMMNVPEDLLDKYAKEMLSKRETLDGLVTRVVDNKLTALMKGKVSLKNKKVSTEEFNKLFTNE